MSKELSPDRFIREFKIKNKNPSELLAYLYDIIPGIKFLGKTFKYSEINPENQQQKLLKNSARLIISKIFREHHIH
ncbi:MAG: hypothetical protein NZ927_03675 [Candidatus Calescibacterium sp.]|nr:hypothetical protein [Candidatus Calescibacterium sp.]